MRYRVIALCSAVPAGRARCFRPGRKKAKSDVKGIFLLTDYPAVTLRPGSTSTINLKLQNYGLPPERLTLSVTGVPTGWTATLIGGGQPVAAALPATNASVALELRLDVPKDAPIGTTNLTVNAQGARHQRLAAGRGDAGDRSAGQADAHAAAPGAARHLEVELRVPARHQERQPQEGRRSACRRTAPQNFDATFTEQYGSQELNALPLDAGQSKDVKLKVRPPNTVAAGKYKVAAKVSADDASATSELVIDITGQPKIDIAGREGVLSAQASAGREDIDPRDPHQFRHRGRPSRSSCRARAPTGWKINFDPEADRPHRAEREQGSAGPGHPDREGGCRRLCHHGARRGARRIGVAVVPGRGHDLHPVGHRRRRAHRRGAAGHGRRRGVVRSAMSDNVIEAQNLTKRYDGTTVVNGISFSRRARARFSGCSARTAPARPPPS